MSDRLRNLRNRPFLIVNTLFRPTNNAPTHKKGWMSESGNTAMFERAWVVDRVSSKLMREATVIIDIMGSSAIKNGYDNGDPANSVTDEKVVEHFLSRHMEKCKEGLDLWLSKQAKTFAQSKEYVELKEKADAKRAEVEAKSAETEKSEG